MAILLYDYCKLEERESKSLKVWKAWHIIIYILIALCGVLNFSFLLSTRAMIDDFCVFYPRNLTFDMVDVTNRTYGETAHNEFDAQGNDNSAQTENADQSPAQDVANAINATEGMRKKERDLLDESLNDPKAVTIVVNNITIIIANSSHRLMLAPSRSLFLSDYECQFAEFMPILSSAFALIWITFFTMCPGGGRASSSGLQQPWRILTPALLFSLVVVVVTGLSFSQTNGGVQAFCAAFADYTNTTTCSAADRYIERSYLSSWGFSGHAAALRAASAGVWAGWACAAALLLARCIAAPDFALRRTAVHLVKDPQLKIIPHLKRTPRRSPRSSRPASAPDTASVKSEPTVSTQVVTASVHGQDTAPPSLPATPVRSQDLHDALEMTEKHSL